MNIKNIVTTYDLIGDLKMNGNIDFNKKVYVVDWGCCEIIELTIEELALYEATYKNNVPEDEIEVLKTDDKAYHEFLTRYWRLLLSDEDEAEMFDNKEEAEKYLHEFCEE